MRCYWNTGFLRDTPPRPPDVSEMLYQLRNPYHFQWLSGDYMVDALLHYLDVACWAKEAQPIARRAQGRRQNLLRDPERRLFDHHCVEFTFADGTAMFVQTRLIGGCWIASAAEVEDPAGVARLDRGEIRGEAARREEVVGKSGGTESGTRI